MYVSLLVCETDLRIVLFLHIFNVSAHAYLEVDATEQCPERILGNERRQTCPKSVSKIKTVATNVSVSATASVDSAVWSQVRARNPMMHLNTLLQTLKKQINHNNDEINDIL